MLDLYLLSNHHFNNNSQLNSSTECLKEVESNELDDTHLPAVSQFPWNTRVQSCDFIEENRANFFSNILSGSRTFNSSNFFKSQRLNSKKAKPPLPTLNKQTNQKTMHIPFFDRSIGINQQLTQKNSNFDSDLKGLKCLALNKNGYSSIRIRNELRKPLFNPLLQQQQQQVVTDERGESLVR